MDVLLVGYYGRKNFGDDVLLQSSLAIARGAWPSANIFVQSDVGTDYIPRQFGVAESHILSSGHRGKFDLVVHGGGGVFFDFTQGSIMDWGLNQLARVQHGYVLATGEAVVRKMLKRARPSVKVRAGWGIGVGTYTSQSRRLRHHISDLRNFDTLMLRDQKSLDNLVRMGLAERAFVGSDIAFLQEHWAPKLPIACPTDRKSMSRLGVVLRDWGAVDGTSYLNALKALLPRISENIDVSFFIFDAAADVDTQRISAGYPTYVWNPVSQSIAEYSTKIGEQDVLLSARAHGAICGAVLGVPSMLIEIEPKLETVHRMLHRSSLLLGPTVEHEAVVSGLDWLHSTGRKGLMHDVRDNRLLAEQSIGRVILESERALAL